jgi:ribose transport system permease protein
MNRSKALDRIPNLASAREAWNANRVADLLVRNSLLIIILLVMVYFATQNDRFLSLGNLRAVLIAAAPFALIALGQSIVILTGGIDLSVGSVVALGAMSAAWLSLRFPPEQLWLAIAIAVILGTLAGVINGLVIAYLDVPPFVATLGMLTGASGVAYVIGGGAPINGLPEAFGLIANTKIFGFQFPVYIMIVAFVLMGLVMKYSAFGLRVYAIGGNRTAAEVAGVNARRTLVQVYTLSGLLAGISGVVLASRVGSGPPSLGVGYELLAIAAVVIGGASLMGGRGTVWGTLLGLIIIQTLGNGLDLMIVPAYWQSVINGVVIVSAVAVDVWANRRRSR